MSQRKTDTLRTQMGDGLDDSIGIRPGESTRPTYANATTSPPRANFVRSRSVGEIQLEQVAPDPQQPRRHIADEEIQQLAADLKARGQLQPIRVRWDEALGKWLIIAGERRWRAAKLAELSTITCSFVDRKMTEDEVRSEQLVENLLREDLKGIEMARAFASLMELNGWNAKQLAESLHISKGKVSKALSLLKLPPDIQQKLEDGAIVPSTAYEIAKVKGEQKQRELAERALAGQITQPEAAEATRRSGTRAPRTRRTTNETFRTSDRVRVAISSRRDVGDAGMIQALIEVADQIRKRSKRAKAKAA